MNAEQLKLVGLVPYGLASRLPNVSNWRWALYGRRYQQEDGAVGTGL